LETFDGAENESLRGWSLWMVGTVQSYGALYAGAGAGGAIGTKEERDVGGVGARIGLMDERLNTRVSHQEKPL
jgi:hypothetical protein